MKSAVSFFVAVLLGGIFPALGQEAEEKTAKAKEIEVPGFNGNILGMDISADRLGVVLDISESMKRSLPGIREALRQKLPKTPVVHVDGCDLQKPEPRAKMINGVAPETVTAVDLLGEHAKVNSILWISDMGDSPNRAGIEAMSETLAEHGIQLYLMSLRNRPGPSLRKLVENTEGAWKIVPTKR